MATKERLLLALDRADKAGDIEAARDLAAMIKSGQYDAPKTGRNKGGLTLSNRDEGFDYRGVDNLALRADVSRGDTAEEEEFRLAKFVGKENVLRDSRGRLAISAQAAQQMGYDTDKPMVIDEPSLMPTMGDIADMRGDAIPALAGIGAGIAATGVGLPAGMAITGLATAAGKALEEGTEYFQGDNLQTGGEVARDILTEGAFGAGGEVLGRGMSAVGRKILQPGRASLREGAEQMMQDSLEMGIIPRVDNVRHGRIVRRIHGVVDTIFGDRNAGRNSAAIGKQMSRLRQQFNREVIPDTDDLGRAIRRDVVRAKEVFDDRAAQLYAFADDVLNGAPQMDITGVQRVAQDLIDALPTSGGNPVSLDSTKSILTRIVNMDPKQKLSAMQAIRSGLRNRMGKQTLTPGISDHQAGLLLDALDETFEATTRTAFDESTGYLGERYMRAEAIRQVKRANEFYKNGIKKFQSNELDKIIRDPGSAGSLDVEGIVDFVLKEKGNGTSRLNRIMKVLPESTRNDLRTVAMDKVLNSMTTAGDTALEEVFYDPKKFKKVLDGFGDNTLNTLFGKAQTRQMRKLQSAIELATRHKKSDGGIVAASIAVRPLQNLGTLVRLGIVRNILSSETALKYLTTGYGTGPKATLAREAFARIVGQMASQGFQAGQQEQDVGARAILAQ